MLETAAVSAGETLYDGYVNPQWVRLLNLLRMNVHYDRCAGVELFASNGRRYLDFLSGYCVHNVGHNHPAIIAALKDEMDLRGPAMLQSHIAERAGELAKRLCDSAGGRVRKAFFCSSGSEGVEAAIKFARVYTGRTGLVYAQGAFHGLTCGALSLMGDPFWRNGFGPLLPNTHEVPFNDIHALAEKLATKQIAAVILEPLQGEAGIHLAKPRYLEEVQALCRRYETLFVVDEVQTGLYRTGPFLASHHYKIDPDMVILAKALSGGLVPCAAVLMTEEIQQAVYGSLKRSIIHTSTFSENGLSMRAGLSALDVLETEDLGRRSTDMGDYARRRLRESLSPYDMVKDIRGLGLLSGIEFGAPRQLGLRLSFEAFQRIHPAMFGQVLVMRLFRDKGILTQICGNNFMVLKVAPPLIAARHHIDEFVDAVSEVVDLMHSSSVFWTEALGLARRVMNV